MASQPKQADVGSQTSQALHALSTYLAGSKATTYARYHAPRYAMLLEHMAQHTTPASRVLDIGLSPFADIAAEAFHRPIDTLGLQDDQSRKSGQHYQFDLNASRNPDQWRTLPQTYDLIVFAEVMEHLYTPPDLVLRYLASLLTPGGLIFIQTPNAVVLHKRLRMLSGKNPYALLVDAPDNPAHFREYTAAELTRYCKASGLSILHRAHASYFDYQYPDDTAPDRPVKRRRWLNRLYGYLPGTFKPGLFFIAQTPRHR